VFDGFRVITQAHARAEETLARRAGGTARMDAAEHGDRGRGGGQPDFKESTSPRRTRTIPSRGAVPGDLSRPERLAGDGFAPKLDVEVWRTGVPADGPRPPRGRPRAPARRWRTRSSSRPRRSPDVIEGAPRHAHSPLSRARAEQSELGILWARSTPISICSRSSGGRFVNPEAWSRQSRTTRAVSSSAPSGRQRIRPACRSAAVRRRLHRRADWPAARDPDGGRFVARRT